MELRKIIYSRLILEMFSEGFLLREHIMVEGEHITLTQETSDKIAVIVESIYEALKEGNVIR